MKRKKMKPLVAYAIETCWGAGGNGRRFLMAHSIFYGRKLALDYLERWKHYDETAKVVRVEIREAPKRRKGAKK